jgi:hypothetical protein
MRSVSTCSLRARIAASSSALLMRWAAGLGRGFMRRSVFIAVAPMGYQEGDILPHRLPVGILSTVVDMAFGPRESGFAAEDFSRQLELAVPRKPR